MSKHMTDREIAIRAVEAIKRKCHDRGVSIEEELNRVGLARQAYYSWKHMDGIPSVYALQGMAACGYDVIKILRGY